MASRAADENEPKREVPWVARGDMSRRREGSRSAAFGGYIAELEVVDCVGFESGEAVGNEDPAVVETRDGTDVHAWRGTDDAPFRRSPSLA